MIGLRVLRTSMRPAFCTGAVVGTLLLTLFGGKASAAEPAAPDRPNFIVFIADDLAWNDVGCYGNPAVRTPVMDALAMDGMRFDAAYLTCSSCSPSRCSILTSRYPHNTGAAELHLPLPAERILASQPLGEAGYHTMAIGKWHLGNAVEDQFDVVRPSKPATMGDAWVRAIRERPRDRPFFMWAAHSDPHRGYQPGTVDPPHDPQSVVVPPFLPDDPTVRQDLANYYDEVSRFDSHIGMVMDELRHQNVAEQTVVFVISDNGRPFPQCKTMVTVPGVRTPMVVHAPGRVRAGTSTDRVVSSIDLMPTILELAGVTIPETFQGVSITHVLKDPAATVRQAAFAEHNWHDYQAFERSVISERYLYVRNWLPNLSGSPPADAVKSPTFAAIQRLDGSGKLTAVQRRPLEFHRPEEFLFDLREDPLCLDNLLDEPSIAPELRSVADSMRDRLRNWQQETGDGFPGAEALTPDGFDRMTGDRLIPSSHPTGRQSVPVGN